jgi:iron complex outermembrane receptor protein
MKLNDNFHVIVDVYYIKVYDRIMLTGNFIKDDLPTFADLFESYGVGGARYYTNALNTSTKGIDITIEFLHTLSEKSSLKIVNSTNLNNTKIIGEVKIPQQVHQYFDVFFDQSEVIRLTKSIPDFRTSTDISLELRDTRLSLKGHYFGSMTIANIHKKVLYIQKVNNGFVFDVQLTQKLRSNINISIGGLNVLNNYPDILATAGDNAFIGKITPHSQFSPYGFAGAQLYFQASFKF